MAFPDPDPDLNHEPEAVRGDEVIAVALWRSLGVLLALGLVAGGVVWWLAREPVREAAHVTPLAPPSVPQRSAPVPKVRFTDVTESSGVRFRHVNGARGEKFLPETMGGGVACLDFDADGDIDLFFVNSMEWPGGGDGRPPALPALYRNDTPAGGPMKFTDVTAGSGLEVPVYGMGAACGDYDNDGRVDLLVTAVGGCRLFHNLGGGRFREVTREAGLGGMETEWSTAATWFDLENDGDLDLFIGNYVRWTPEIDREVNNVLVGVGRAYGRPWNYPGTMPRLFRNERGGRFADVSARSGLQLRNPATGVPLAKTLAVAPIDLNEDGWMDLVVANDTVRNLVFTNRHDGTFAEVGVESGIAYDAYGQARGAMGIDAARFRNDETLGIAIGNFANEMNALYVSQGPRERLEFADAAIAEGLGPASQLLLKFGLFFFDYDLDGRLDVLTVNGHIEEEIEKVQAAVKYRQPAQLFWNAGTGQTFVNVGPEVAGPDLFVPRVGRGSAYADFDGDGDLDVVMTQVNGPAAVFRNDLDRATGWIRVRLEGTRSNRDAIGAWVYARVGGQTMARQVMPTRSYLSQSELPVTLGWSGGRLENLEIRWPDGRRQPVEIPAEGAILVVKER